jgi:hypothetical protein
VTITFKTIHASKGLEADHVIILGVDNAKLGFPSMIVDDPLLSLVSPEAEPFPNAEERRVMYVAVTRARQTVTILASEARPSVFVEELMKEPEFGVVVPLEAQKHTHTCPGCGGASAPHGWQGRSRLVSLRACEAVRQPHAGLSSLRCWPPDSFQDQRTTGLQ